MKPLKFLIIGAGSRGTAYARAVTTATQGSIAAVAEPDPYKRRIFGEKFIWGTTTTPKPNQAFADWRDWVSYETSRRSAKAVGADQEEEEEEEEEEENRIDGIFICTLDETHIDILSAVSPFKDLHILCEKPLALSLDDCLSVYATRRENNAIFSIGHVLRYSPHNLLLRRLLRDDRVIGDIVSLEHTEPVGYWHFAHSYVRGNWRRQTPAGDGSLLTKSCHDIDFILWLLDSPPPLSTSTSTSTSPPPSTHGIEAKGKRGGLRTITSTGHLTQFRRTRKPTSAGPATNCLSCPIERECLYSAVRIYRDQHLARGERGWPVNVVCPDIEDYPSPPSSASAPTHPNKSNGTDTAEENLLSRLREDYDAHSLGTEEIAARTWYGRCVWESDNNVCDDQLVTLTWDDSHSHPHSAEEKEEEEEEDKPLGGKTASFHMISPTEKQCERRGRVYGTKGEVEYDSRTIKIYSFETRETTVIEVPRQPPEEERAHGGGDYGLARGFVSAVDAVVNRGWGVRRAQMEFVGCLLEDVVKSHAVVFAAEEARREEKVVKWAEWWEGKLALVGIV